MHGDIKYPVNFQRFGYTSAQAKPGGELKLYGFGSFDSFNPFIPKGQVADSMGLMYESLMTPSLDEPMTYYGLVAQSIEYAQDRSWIIFHIHPKARFHDGKAISADDVVFSFNTLVEKGDPTYRFMYADVDKVEALSTSAVKFHLNNTDNRELLLIVGQLPVLPQHYWQNKDFTQSSLDIPIGSGPYTIDSFEPGRRLTLKRVANHWSKDLPVNRGLYNFDRIVRDYYQDENIALEAIKAGEYDLRRERVSRLWAVSYNGPGIESGKMIKTEFPDNTPQGMQGFFLNLRKAKFKNIALRKALNLAFDFEWTNAQLFYGAYQRCNSFFANSELAAEELPKGRELEILKEYKDQLNPEIFTTEFTNPVSDGSGRNRKNLREAKKILDAAGYKVVNNQLIDPADGKPVVIEQLLFDSAFERIVNPYAKNLKLLGIELVIRRVDSSQFINRVRKFDFDMIVRRFIPSTSPGNEQRDFWSSQAADLSGSQNIMGVKHPVVDALVERLIQAPTREELVHTTRALDRVLLHQHYVIPQWYSNTHRVAYWNKFHQPEILPHYDSGFTRTPMTWWYSPKKAAHIQ